MYEAGLLKLNSGTAAAAPESSNCKLLDCPSNLNPFNLGFNVEYGMNPVLANLMGVADNTNHADWNATFVKLSRITKPSTRLLLGDATNAKIEGVICYIFAIIMY